jgi:hypothetical protein
VHLIGKGNIQSIREYETTDYNIVYQTVYDKLLEHYTKEDILKVDVWLLSQTSPQVQDYLARKKPENNDVFPRSRVP